MTKLKPMFEWKPEMLKEPIYVLHAYNYRITIEKAKEIYEVISPEIAKQIIALFTEDYLTIHRDAPVVASTCIETYAMILMDKSTEATNKETLDLLNGYVTSFGYTDILTAHETEFKKLAETVKSAVGGRRAKYERSYLMYIVKCMCMNFMSHGHL